jgi:hypothetical protein
MCNFSRAAHAMPSGKLRAFTDVGGYPLIYLTKANDVLCAKCATDDDSVTACDVHWEGEPLTCDECSEEIESAYGVADDYEEAMS